MERESRDAPTPNVGVGGSVSFNVHTKQCTSCGFGKLPALELISGRQSVSIEFVCSTFSILPAPEVKIERRVRRCRDNIIRQQATI